MTVMFSYLSEEIPKENHCAQFTVSGFMAFKEEIDIGDLDGKKYPMLPQLTPGLKIEQTELPKFLKELKMLEPDAGSENTTIIVKDLTELFARAITDKEDLEIT